MKKVRMMVLEDCPHCHKAFKLMDELMNENPEYRKVEIEVVDENKNPQLAESLDYWYVPTFYVEDEKIHEGVPTKEKIQQVYVKAI